MTGWDAQDDCTCLDAYASARAVSRYGDGPFPPHPPTRDTLDNRHVEPDRTSGDSGAGDRDGPTTVGSELVLGGRA